MNIKETFTSEEWKTLIKAPMMVSYAVIGAAPSARAGYMKEMKAVADAIVDASEQAPAGSLLQAVVDDIKSNAMDEAQGPRETVSVSEIKDRALDLCRQVISILQSKAGAQDADSYKRWLLAVGQSVAQASAEGGFLGFGGARVSDSEAATLSEIATVLETDLTENKLLALPVRE